MRWLKQLLHSNAPTQPIAVTRSRLIYSLEPRILFDGALIASATDSHADHLALPEHPITPSQTTEPTTVLFIDARVQDSTLLTQGLSNTVKVIQLDANKDGVQQIADALRPYQNLSSIQIISHGAEGEILIGSSTLSENTIQQYQTLLHNWGTALKEHGDILIYGCRVAGSEIGTQFISTLSTLTGADVAASSDLTGAAGLGGNWVLEQRTGTIETNSVLTSYATEQYTDLLSVPTTENFSSITNPIINQTTPLTLNGLIYSGSNNILISVDSNDSTTVGTNFGGNGQVLSFASTNRSDAFVKIASANQADNFKLTSINVETLGANTGIPSHYTITGYNNNSAIAGASATVDFGTSGMYDSIAYTQKDTIGDIENFGGAGGSLAFSGAAWSNIDEVRFTINDGLKTDLFIAIDNLVLATPTAPTTTVQTIAFSADTGTSATDKITKTAAQTITGTISIGLVSDEIVQVSIDYGAIWSTATTTDTNWSITNQTLVGTNSVQARVFNTGGGGTALSNQYILDTTAPTLNITLADTPAGNADSLTYRATFSEAVTGVDANDFTLITNGTNGTIGTVNGNGNGTTYDITVSDVSGNGTLRLNLKNTGTGITDTAGNAIAADTVTGTPVTLDHTAPTVTSVTVPTNGSYRATQTLGFTVNTSEAVTVTGTPRIALTLGSSPVNANYVSGSGSNALLFQYTVTTSDLDTDGIAVGALNTNNGTLRDAAGNNLTLTLTPLGDTSRVLVDTVLPTVTITPLGTYAGNAINLTYRATFSEAVTGVDANDFTLSKTGTDGTIGIVTGSGTTYEITVSVVSGNGTLGLDLKGGDTGITDTAGNAIATDVINGTPVTLDHTAPTITDVILPTDQTYGIGQNLNIQLVFSETIVVDSTNGTPFLTITLNTGGAVHANYVSGSGTNTLTFSYTVVTSNQDSNGITLSESITPNGGTLKDAAGNTASTTFTNLIGPTTNILVDGVRPNVRSITPTDNTNANAISYEVTFTENVQGVDVTDFNLSTTNTAAGTIASVAMLNNNATYRVTVNRVSGDGALKLNVNDTGTGITDNAGNPGNNKVTLVNLPLQVDHTPPRLSLNNAPTNGTYAIGQALDFIVSSSEFTTVTDKPFIPITIGGRTVNAEYTEGSGTQSLTFQYTVAAGDVDIDGITVDTTLNTNGGTIRDGAGNNATLTLNTIVNTTGILVDGVTPTVTIAKCHTCR